MVGHIRKPSLELCRMYNVGYLVRSACTILEHNENDALIFKTLISCANLFQHIHQSRMDRSLIVAPSSIRVACLSDADGTCESCETEPAEVHRSDSVFAGVAKWENMTKKYNCSKSPEEQMLNGFQNLQMLSSKKSCC